MNTIHVGHYVNVGDADEPFENLVVQSHAGREHARELASKAFKSTIIKG